MAKNNNLLGSWAFLVGFILAVVLGAIGGVNPTITYLLVIVGLLVGLLNIADKEVEPFLISGVVLIIASSLGQDVVKEIGWLSGVLKALSAIFVPATVIVAIRNVFTLAKN